MSKKKHAPRKRKRCLQRLVEHHIIPTSRGGEDDNRNKAKVREDRHNHYHHVFENRTPEEIIGYLVEDFWNGQDEAVFSYLENKYANDDSVKYNLGMDKWAEGTW